MADTFPVLCILSGKSKNIEWYRGTISFKITQNSIKVRSVADFI